MTNKQAQQLELIRNAASAYGCNVRATSAPDTYEIWLGRNNGKTLYFKLNAQGKPTHVRLDSIYGLEYTRQQAVELLQEIVDLYVAEMDHEQIAEMIKDQAVAEREDAGIADYQVWWKLDIDSMPESMRPKFLDKQGNNPEFLAVSGLNTREDAQIICDRYQQCHRGNIYFVKEVAA